LFVKANNAPSSNEWESKSSLLNSNIHIFSKIRSVKIDPPRFNDIFHRLFVINLIATLRGSNIPEMKYSPAKARLQFI